MNKIEKEIEEMAREIESVQLYGTDNYGRKISHDSVLVLAKHLHNAGYRNCKDKVVLSKEELNTLIGSIEKSSEIKAEELEKARKETARDIIEMLVGYTFEDDGWTWTVSQEDIQWLAEKYGVEVE